jgi:hypothetical protein
VSGNKRVPTEVQTAIDLAHKADWDVSIRNEKVVIKASDGVAITIGMNPNDESMKVFRSSARQYNLIGDGPARTPKESEELLAKLEAETEKKAAEANAQRKIFEAAQKKKQEEADAAAVKAQEATQNGLVAVAEEPKETMPVFEIPVGIPVFNKDLLGKTQSDLFLILSPAGIQEYYCIECWEHGLKFTSKRPQGLAMHRGIRHGLYGSSTPSAPVTARETVSVNSALPADVHDALELLVSVLGDNFSGSATSAELEGLQKQVADLEKQLSEVRAQAERDLGLSDKQYTDAKAAFDQATKADKKKIYDLTKELSEKDGKHEIETEQLMKTFKMLLNKIQEALNTRAPIQAVGEIDGLIKPYMD